MINTFRHKHLKIHPITDTSFLIEGGNYFKIIRILEEGKLEIRVGNLSVSESFYTGGTKIKEPSDIYLEVAKRYKEFLGK